MKIFCICIALLVACTCRASKLFIPMGAEGQANHLKAYGIVYAALQQGVAVDWLVNYKSGSFGIDNINGIAALCDKRGVSYTKMTNNEYDHIVNEVANANNDYQVVKLDRPPKIAVYTPPNKEPWDDAVTMALTYAEIPFDKLYADEVLGGRLAGYDWLHLHHEDFTGQYGKFWGPYHNADWYIADQQRAEATAARHGYKKVSQMQLAVVKKIRDFVGNGGNLFAMCMATDTYDIALAAEGVDICSVPFDGDPVTPDAARKLRYDSCFAFQNFTVFTDPLAYGLSDVDNSYFRYVPPSEDYFTVAAYSAKKDIIPAMLCQVHTRQVHGFMGKTTAFRNVTLKLGVLVMGDNKAAGEARYIHGEYKKGAWTFYGGHDPEDYAHAVGAPQTDLSLHPNSPGYRLILNNLLLPASGIKPGTKAIENVPARVVEAPALLPAVTKAEKTPATPKPPAKAPEISIPPPAPTRVEETPAPPLQLLQNNISIILNAATNMLEVNTAPGSGEKDKIVKVTIVNETGNEVSNGEYNSDKATVDISALPPGIYRVFVNGAYAGKAIKN